MCANFLDQYLVVKRLDGTSEHIAGPTSRFLDVGVDDTMSVQDCITLTANEALVVYRRGAGSSGAAASSVDAGGKKSKKSKDKDRENLDNNASPSADSGNVERDIIRGPW